MLKKAAQNIVERSLKIKPSERVLLVCDQAHQRFTELLAAEAKGEGTEIDVHLLVESLRPYKRASKPLQRLASVANVVVYFLRDLDGEALFRGDLVTKGLRGLTRGRVLAAPGISEKSITRLAQADFSEIKDLTLRVVDYLRDAEQVRVTNKAGTDITFSLKGRDFSPEYGNIAVSRRFANFPPGEAQTCPVEETFNGTVVARHMLKLTGRMRFDFEKGKLVNYHHFQKPRALEKLIEVDPILKNIGEFGVGTNPKAWLSHHFTIAEKVMGTVHFGLGDSRKLGKTTGGAHMDIIVTKPSVLVEGRYLMKEGKFMFE